MSVNDRLSISELKSFIGQCVREAEALEKAAPDYPPKGAAAFKKCAKELRDTARKASKLLEKMLETSEESPDEDSL
jgi:hypothetical protein